MNEVTTVDIVLAVDQLNKSPRGKAVMKNLYDMLDGPACSLDRQNQRAVMTILSGVFYSDYYNHVMGTIEEKL